MKNNDPSRNTVGALCRRETGPYRGDFLEPRAMKSRRDYELSARDAGCFALPADLKMEASVV